MNICKKLRVYVVNRKLKKLNRELTSVSDIKGFLKLENRRLDLLAKINKIRGIKK